jgi:hypothetical protein
MSTYTGIQNGGDLVLSDGDVVYGVISNLNLFYVPPGITVYVKNYDGTNYGQLEVHALNILIEGSISAVGSGYGGGAGGGGGKGGTSGLDCDANTARGGYANRGASDGYYGASNSNRSGGRGGAGSAGAGPYGGAYGIYGAGDTSPGEHGGIGSSGGPGGYRGTAENGDSSTDETIYMGSGGGAGGGGGGGYGDECV